MLFDLAIIIEGGKKLDDSLFAAFKGIACVVHDVVILYCICNPSLRDSTQILVESREHCNVSGSTFRRYFRVRYAEATCFQ